MPCYLRYLIIIKMIAYQSFTEKINLLLPIGRQTAEFKIRLFAVEGQWRRKKDRLGEGHIDNELKILVDE